MTIDFRIVLTISLGGLKNEYEIIRAFVTGGASGLGEATVRSIVAQGGQVLIADLSEEKGNLLGEEAIDSVLFVKTEVTSEEDVGSAFEQGISAFGSNNTVVNCQVLGYLKNYSAAKEHIN